MKLSLDLSDEDVAALDDYVRQSGLPTRSAAIQRAIQLLTRPEVERAYAAAWDEWVMTGEEEIWDSTSADGIDREEG